MATHVETLQVGIRKSEGTREARRLRRSGAVPAILYGRGQDPVYLSVPTDAFTMALRHGTRVVKLAGELAEDALIREVQWDAMGANVLHVDFTRFAAGDRIQTTVALELRGEAPGVHEGGVVQLLVHELELDCPVVDIPDVLQVNINHLHLGQTIMAADLKLPEGARLVHGNVPIVECEVMTEAAEEEAVEGVAAEPEVIGRKEKAEEEED
ncbi:MAG: 50S ribosomal protein L25 [Pirellulales bacterium]